MPRKHKLTRHHLTPRAHYKPDYRPVLNSPQNVLYLLRFKHDAWHAIFREASIEQAIAILQRVCRNS